MISDRSHCDEESRLLPIANTAGRSNDGLPVRRIPRIPPPQKRTDDPPKPAARPDTTAAGSACPRCVRTALARGAPRALKAALAICVRTCQPETNDDWGGRS
jgi:hypothetical protein